MAKDSPKKAEDLEVASDKADEIKGGLLPSEPGGTPRKIAVKKHKQHKVVKNYSGGKHY